MYKKYFYGFGNRSKVASDMRKKSNKICQGKLVDHTHKKVNNSLFLTEVKAASTKLSGNKFLFKIKI
jgi:hypothetical protein